MGPLTLPNRVFMAPLTRSRADNDEHAPTELHAEYYRQRASSGLIISEGTVVSPRGVGYIRVPGIYSQEQVQAWRAVTDAVHAEGGHIFVQLWHVGRISHPDFHDGALPLAPSAINPNGMSFTVNGRVPTVTPKEMSTAEIHDTIREFRLAARNAVAAGFDGIEVHSSNGYLFHQFFSRSSNQRTDEYGGSVENRARFLFDVLDAIGEEVDLARVGIRLNPMVHEGAGIVVDEETAPTFDHIVKTADHLGLAYLHMTRPPNRVESPFAIDDVIGHYRALWSGVYVANMNYTIDEAEQEIASGRADAVAFGRPWISNPDLTERIRRGSPLADWNPKTFYTRGPEGYTDYPRL